jgi:hypothetical protein
MLNKIKSLLPKQVIEAPDITKNILIENYIDRHLTQNPKYANPLNLNRFEFQAFSQYGEDGIIREIFNRIGTTNKYFVEFGVETGVECNTALLLFKTWSGTWIEGRKESVEAIRENFPNIIESGRLTVLNEFITAENIEELFTRANVPAEPDFVSIDIDRNDYYIWNAFTKFRPRVISIEYNAVFPPDVDFVVAYDSTAMWDGTSDFGASIAALNRLARSKNYSLVVCSFSGVNAFFVRNDCLTDNFIMPGDVLSHYEPPRYFLYKKEGHPRKITL